MNLLCEFPVLKFYPWKIICNAQGVKTEEIHIKTING